MTVYVTYQCSVCRRTKDIAKDNVRAMISQCTITKGCLGSLYKIGETLNYQPAAPVSGLTDWYPRGEKPTVTAATPAEVLVGMTTSSTGGITLALLMTQQEAFATPNILLNLTQRLTTNVPYNQYIFEPTTATTTLSGKDSTGSTMRFDQTAINEDRVSVLVNGVARVVGTGPNNIVLTPSTVTFNTALSAGDVVSVIVYSSSPVISISVPLVANYSGISTVNEGSWSNVRWVDQIDPATGKLQSATSGKLWWLYTSAALTELSVVSSLLLTSITSAQGQVLVPGTVGDTSTARFLLAAPPYDNADRYLQFYIDLSVLTEDYLLNSAISTIAELSVDEAALVALSPPLQLINATTLAASSYVTADTFSTTDSVSSDTPATRLSSTVIIGPV